MTPDVFVARGPSKYDDIRGQNDRRVWQSLRSVWTAMGFDPDNPFGGFLTRGGFAVIKPNWVFHNNDTGGGLDCLVTHPSLIYYMIDWCAKAMNGQGRIIVGDAPVQGCRFDLLMQETHMGDVADVIRNAYPNIDLRIDDWRLTVWNSKTPPESAHSCSGPELSSASHKASRAHYSELDCGSESFLEEISQRSDRFRVTMYNPNLMRPHHRPGVHRYLIRNEALDADLLINLAKMKTHEKAGLTGALKNLVGVNGHKEYLPHHTKGSYASGGDSYLRDNCFARWAEDVYDRRWEREPGLSRFQRWFLRTAGIMLHRAARLTGGGNIPPGSWAGNNTVWRMVLDLNHLLYFGERKPKKILNVVDGIIAGQGRGPLHPQPKPVGLILAGENPAYVDAAIGRLMGYDISRIPLVYQAIYNRRSQFGGPFLDAAPVCFIGESGTVERGTWCDIESLGFLPPPHWRRSLAIT